MVTRLLAAAAVVIAYAIFTALVLRAHRLKKSRAGKGNSSVVTQTSSSGFGAASAGEAPDTSPLLVAYASQTGYAEQLAWQTARSLRATNVPLRVRALSDLSLADLATAERALFVVSTYGEGDAPDAGMTFVQRVMSETPPLSTLGYGVLALGDSTYRNFCGFGRTLDGWLKRQCAVPMFDLVEVDNADEAALRSWQRNLGALAGRDDPVEWTAPRTERWRITKRRLLNPGSAGLPCFHIELTPVDRLGTSWNAGDIAVLNPPGSTHREYSIASLPSDGALHILVRQSRRADGTLGVASGWLTGQAGADANEVPLRIRPNTNFHAPSDDRPMILIGNGTGIAGLRSHLKARTAAGRNRNWLIFGERNARHDTFYREDLERWRATGALSHVSFAFSRDQAERIYVQHIVERCAETVRHWVADGASIYVCGSAEGMAPAVDAALAAAMGRETLQQLIVERRYRRDVY